MSGAIGGAQGESQWRWALTLALCGVAAGAAPHGALADGLDLEVRLAEALAEVPVERMAATIRSVLAVQEGATVVHGVSPGSLRPHDPGNQVEFFLVAEGRFATEGGAGGCSYAPLHLPQGSTLTGLVAWYNAAGSGDIDVEVRRRRTTSNTEGSVLASIAVSGPAGGIQVATDLTVDDPEIDNSLYAYFLYACLAEIGFELDGLYLTYTP